MVVFIFMGPSQQSGLLGHSFLSGHNSKQPERVSMNVWDLRQCQMLRCKANSHEAIPWFFCPLSVGPLYSGPGNFLQRRNL